jgi:TrmH family RNA methyltransferase
LSIRDIGLKKRRIKITKNKKLNMKKNLPKIVLVDLKYPMNLGSITRTMFCCGYRNVNLVRPCKKWNDMDAIKFSLFARSILDKAKVFNELSELKKKDTVFFGFSRRIGRKRSNPLFLSELNSFIERFYPNKKINFVFGGESSGLSTKDLNECDHIVTLDKDLVDGSLSLPMAVAIAMYEYKKGKAASSINSSKLGNVDEGQAGALLDKVKELLKKTRFIGNRDDRRVMAKIKDIVKRMSVNEVRLVHTILGRIKNK